MQLGKEKEVIIMYEIYYNAKLVNDKEPTMPMEGEYIGE